MKRKRLCWKCGGSGDARHEIDRGQGCDECGGTGTMHPDHGVEPGMGYDTLEERAMDRECEPWFNRKR